MSLVRKLKPDRNIAGPLIPLSMLAIFGFISLIFGIPAGLYSLVVMCGLFALFYLYLSIRTGNPYLLVFSAEGAFLIYLLIQVSGTSMANPFDRVEFALAYFTGFGFFAFLIIYLVLTRKAKWRGREIFELAGEPVEETGNGYTSRPRPVGKVDYSPEQLRSFVRFCARNLIGLPYYTSKNITLVLVKMGEEWGRLLGLSGDFRDATWVNFSEDGEVSVHIAQKDYLDYREPLAFDALCASLGQVFVDFCEFHSKGEGVRVVDRLDDLKIGIFS